MRRRIKFAILVAATSLACTNHDLTRERAADLVRTLDGFKREPHFWLQTEMPFKSVFKCESQTEVERAPLNQFATSMNWVRYETRSTVVGIDTKADCPSMALTAAGNTASAKWQRGRASLAGETSWAVPIGQRELVQVTGLVAAPDGSTVVEFEWKWVPNETGTLLRRSVPQANNFFDRPKKGRANCRRWDDGWRCTLGMWTTAADGLGEFTPRWR
jgi:hypothetical protein